MYFSNVVNKILRDQSQSKNPNKYTSEEVRNILLDLSAEDFFKYYSDRKAYEELPLLTADGIAIPKIGLRKALYDEKYINKVPLIAGSTRDEVKLWLASAEYFVDIDFSPVGSVLGIPKVVLKNDSKNYMFELEQTRKFDFNLFSLIKNKEYVKKISF